MSRTRLFALAFLFGAGSLAYAAIRPGTLGQEPPMPQPTEQHKMLMMGVGEWEGTLKMWEPGKDPQETPAKESVTALGPFWTQSKFTCKYQGMDFAGSATMGYDPNKKKFVGTWIDVMNSELTVMEGDVDAKTKKLVMRWVGPDMTGARVPHRFEMMFGADNYTSTFFNGEGEGVKTIEITMKRKAKGEAKGVAK